MSSLKESFMNKGGRNPPPPEGAKPPPAPPAQRKPYDSRKQIFTDPLLGLIEEQMDDFAYYARFERDPDGIEARKAVIGIVLKAINKVGYRMVD